MKFNPLPPLWMLKRDFALDDVLILVNLRSRGPAGKGQQAGSLDAVNQRWRVYYRGVRYMRYRIVWALANSRLPGQMTIDHINRDQRDDRPENLRRLSFSEQRHNSVVSARPGMRGVYPIELAGGRIRYRVCITVAKIARHFGTYDTVGQARVAYLNAAEEMGFLQFLPPDITELYEAHRAGGSS